MQLAAINIEEVKTALVIVQLLVSVGMAILLQHVNGKTKRIDTLESELKRATTDAIDTRLIALRQEREMSNALLAQRIEQIDRRLEMGDQRFTALEQKGHKLEVDVLRSLNELKDLVATKDDLDRLRKEVERRG